jgi:hypothetical protein
MKKLLYLLALLCCIGLPTWAIRSNHTVAGKPDIVVVRVRESELRIRAIITRGKGQNQFVEFGTGSNEKGLTTSAEGYYGLLEPLYQEGYVLKSTFNSSNVNAEGMTLVLEKQP